MRLRLFVSVFSFSQRDFCRANVAEICTEKYLEEESLRYESRNVLFKLDTKFCSLCNFLAV